MLCNLCTNCGCQIAIFSDIHDGAGDVVIPGRGHVTDNLCERCEKEITQQLGEIGRQIAEESFPEGAEKWFADRQKEQQAKGGAQ